MIHKSIEATGVCGCSKDGSSKNKEIMSKRITGNVNRKENRWGKQTDMQKQEKRQTDRTT